MRPHPHTGQPGGHLAAQCKGRPWWKRQDGAIRQQVIEQLMHQIMQYDAEFRREEATSAVSSHAKH